MVSPPVYCRDFIGRTEELAFLRRELDDARAGTCRFVPITGEAGIGKSRLVAELGAIAAACGARFAVGRSMEIVQTPYGPVRDALRALGGIDGVLDGASRSTAGERKEEFFRAIALRLRSLAESGTLVLVLEDVHWADDATLELAAYLLERLERVPLLLALTYRGDEIARRPALASLVAALSRKRCALVALAPLSSREMRLLLAGARAARPSVSAEAIARIEALADGNPLFAEELLRTALENEGELPTHRYPPTISAMLGARIAHFDDDERAILTFAAVAGEYVDVEFLSAVSGAPRDDVLRLLQRAQFAGLVVASPERPERLAFRHEVFRDLLARQLIEGLAAPVHARIAAQIELAPDARARIAELAYHWSAARDRAKALEYNERAGDEALAAYAYRDAIRFYDEALRVGARAGADRARLDEKLGTMLYLDGRGLEPQRYFRAAFEEYRMLADRPGMARALLLEADQCWVDAQTNDALERARRAVEYCDETDGAARGRAWLALARYSITTARVADASEQLAAAARTSETFDAETTAVYHEVRAEAHAALGRTALATSDFREASRLAKIVDVSDLIVQVENNFAISAADLGSLSLASERHELAIAEAQRTGLLWRVAYSALNYANTLALAGRLSLASELVTQALDCAVDTATATTKAAAVGIPLGLLLNDDLLVRRCAHESAIEHAFNSGEPQRIGAVSAAFAQLLAARGAGREAKALLRRALGVVWRLHRCWNFAIQLALLGGAREIAAAQALVRQVEGGRERSIVRAHARLIDCIASRRRGKVSRSAGEAAAGEFAVLGWRLCEALALDAAGLSSRASALYREMGALHPQTFARRSHGVDGALTPRQEQIARLVATGATNRGIADRLGISENTVEHHLLAVFSRLGVRTRSQLTAQIVGRGQR
jgi:predicted ATPase/DNA-binding CsgD family transcriptional regulator